MDYIKLNPKLKAKFALIDFKACLKHAHGAGVDPDCRYDSVTGREVNTAEHGLRTFLDMYVTHLLEDEGYAPWQILVAHEGGHAYRSMLNPDYKANRKPKEGEEPKKGPEDQEEYTRLEAMAKQFLAGIGATQLRVEGVEGDDVIAHLEERLSPNYPCSVYTVDADMLKLTGPRTVVYLKLKPILMEYDSFSECESVVPKNMHGYLSAFVDPDGWFEEEFKENLWHFITLYKSICGDSSDGYNGVSGLGDKAWSEIVKTYGADGLEELEGIVANRKFSELQELLEEEGADNHKKLAKLYEQKQQWRQSWQLAQLHPQLCWKPSKKSLTKIQWFKRVPSEERVKKVLMACDCMDYFEQVEELLPQTWLIDSTNYEETDLDEFTALCKETFVVGWDYETSAKNLEKGAVNVRSSVPTGASFCAGSNFQYAFYITTNHKDSANLPQYVISDFIDAIPDGTATVAHNLQFEQIVTGTNYGKVLEDGFDTMTMCSYVDENQDLGLKDCSKRELNYNQETYDEVLAKAGATDMRGVTADQVMSYGIDDSLVCCHLFVLFWLRLQLEGTWDFYSKHEPVFAKRTALSHIEGVEIDFDEMEVLHQEDIEQIETNDARLRELLAENCSTVNRENVKRYLSAESGYISAKAKAAIIKLDDEALKKRTDSAQKYFADLIELDDLSEKVKERLDKAISDGEGLTNALADVEVLKFTHKAMTGSVYVPYKEWEEMPIIAPSVKNLAEVVKRLNFEVELTSVAKSKLSDWESAVRKFDFDTGQDLFDSMTEDQQTFITLLRAAQPFFKPADRDNPAYLRFSDFCNGVLEVKSKKMSSGTELNAGSPIQMQHMFYCMLGVPVRLRGKVTKGSGRDVLGFEGSPSTDALAVDTALAEDVDGDDTMEWVGEALNCLKRIKEAETRIKLYFKPYAKLINYETGRIHPSIRPCGTITRRPSGGDPNILQVSKHQKKAAMRSIFKPIREDHIIIAIDFAGQELRILASVTKDKNLLSAYLGQKKTQEYLDCVNNGGTWEITTAEVASLDDVRDIHSSTAAGIVQIFGLDEDGKLVAGGSPVVKTSSMSYEEFVSALADSNHEFHVLTEKVRKKPAKTTNFLMAYGGSSQALSQKLIIKEAQSDKIINETMKMYPNIEKEQDATLRFAKENGYAETAYGNRRHATKDIFSNQRGLVNRMGRQLFNARIQGCAADILKVVFYEAEYRHEDGPIWDRLDAVMMAPVYDEIVASVHVDSAVQYVKEMRDIMNLLPPNQAVPMMADISLGPDWQKQKELGPYPSDELVRESALEALEQRKKQLEDKATA